ncbi:MAG: mechanosensitive ion channel [Prolixibacteraceae bacterium]|nr:mechanosensitive ion channel [Prolixibacteraceae bacterium]MDD4754508.1 mechanosensitive ion channel [Prolixibacteraceae bacterium]
MRELYKFLLDNIREIDKFDSFARPGSLMVTLLILILIAWVSHYLTRKILIGIAVKIADRTKTTWDDILVKRKVFRYVAHFIPAFIIYYSADFASPVLKQELAELSDAAVSMLSNDYYLNMGRILTKFAQVYFIFIFIFLFNAVLNTGLDIYNTTDYAIHRPVKGYVQLFKILIFFLSGILIIAVLLGKDPTVLLAGLGAMGAVLLLVFKDSILGFVASIQLSGNNMVKIGDWIEMRSRGADGTVFDITLNTVKVQNWDKTISTIPTYAMVTESFINWKGMEESGGRRIKRAVYIDMTSIKLCDSELLHRLQNFLIIKDYIIGKEKEIAEYNALNNISDDDVVSGRRQTNIGIFRKYLEVYLKQHPMINNDMTFLIRHLQPLGKGLPIEIYVFCKEKSWASYESIQADIFDHILAVIPRFDLRVFQEPSGADFSKLVTS